jgi:hypothetical protein
MLKNMITLYKFRSLTTEKELKRLKDIIKTGEFWCSEFSKLNDPMEGVFKANLSEVSAIYKNKQEYKICSFSSDESLDSSLMWGHYANGLKGLQLQLKLRKMK